MFRSIKLLSSSLVSFPFTLIIHRIILPVPKYSFIKGKPTTFIVLTHHVINLGLFSTVQVLSAPWDRKISPTRCSEIIAICFSEQKTKFDTENSQSKRNMCYICD